MQNKQKSIENYERQLAEIKEKLAEAESNKMSSFERQIEHFEQQRQEMNKTHLVWLRMKEKKYTFRVFGRQLFTSKKLASKTRQGNEIDVTVHDTIFETPHYDFL